MNLRNFYGICAAVLMGFPTIALAGPRDDVLEALGKCAAVADDKDRLACYDALTPRVKDALAVPPESLSHEPTKEEQKSWFGFDFGALLNGDGSPKQTTPAQFGSDTVAAPPQAAGAPPPDEEIESITAGVVDYSFTPFGKFIVFLDNGQIWRQVEGDSDQARFLKNAKDNKVAISRGMIGSYNLQINDSARIFKVKRVK
jgi:hypothetical protein